MNKIILMFAMTIITFGLASCVLRPHVPNQQQGNIIDQKEIDKLKIGMSKNEVRELLGDPVLTNIFDRRCFIYAYTNQINRGKISSKNTTTCFDANGYLVTIENS